MSVSTTHWTDHLTPEESLILDDIQVSIVRVKDQLTELRAKERRYLDLGTSRKRRGIMPE